MIVITHHGISWNLNGEYFRQQLESLHKPGFAMIEIASGFFILPTKKCAANAAGNAVVVGRGL
jgi:hypothetical protein